MVLAILIFSISCHTGNQMDAVRNGIYVNAPIVLLGR
jgi:hypothetical protein